MHFRFVRVCLVLLIVLMPFLFGAADETWNISRSGWIRSMSYDEKSMLILVVLGLAVVICAKIAAGNPKDEKPNEDELLRRMLMQNMAEQQARRMRRYPDEI